MWPKDWGSETPTQSEPFIISYYYYSLRLYVKEIADTKGQPLASTRPALESVVGQLLSSNYVPYTVRSAVKNLNLAAAGPTPCCG